MRIDLRTYRNKVLSWHEDGVLPAEIAKALGLTKTQVELILIAWGPR